MARLVYGLNVSLDGYADHRSFCPGSALLHHFTEQTRDLAAAVYGRGMYEVMRYWDDDDPTWTPGERAFATAWRATPKWVVSTTLTAVGPGATLVDGSLPDLLRRLRADLDGDVELAGPTLAGQATQLGLIQEYRLYLHSLVCGGGPRFFAGPRPPLRLVSTDTIDGVVRLGYVPA